MRAWVSVIRLVRVSIVHETGQRHGPAPPACVVALLREAAQRECAAVRWKAETRLSVTSPLAVGTQTAPQLPSGAGSLCRQAQHQRNGVVAMADEQRASSQQRRLSAIGHRLGHGAPDGLS